VLYPLHCCGGADSSKPLRTARAHEAQSLRTLLMDVLAHLPVALVLWDVPGISMTGRALMCANRVLGLHHTWNWFVGTWARLASYPRYDQPVAVFVHLLLALHVAACLWFLLLANQTCDSFSTASSTCPPRSSGVTHSYFAALYW